MIGLAGCEQIGFPIALVVHTSKTRAGHKTDKTRDMPLTGHQDVEINFNSYLRPDKIKFCYIDTR